MGKIATSMNLGVFDSDFNIQDHEHNMQIIDLLSINRKLQKFLCFDPEYIKEHLQKFCLEYKIPVNFN
jgi:hypothetical protein